MNINHISFGSNSQIGKANTTNTNTDTGKNASFGSAEAQSPSSNSVDTLNNQLIYATKTIEYLDNVPKILLSMGNDGTQLVKKIIEDPANAKNIKFGENLVPKEHRTLSILLHNISQLSPQKHDELKKRYYSMKVKEDSTPEEKNRYISYLMALISKNINLHLYSKYRTY